MRSFVTILLAGFVLAANPLRAEEKKPALINLARLSIARVSVSGVSGGRAVDDQFYGAQRLFDADAEIVNGINYKYWSADVPPNWVVVRFSRPVTFSGLVLTMSTEFDSSYGPGPMRVQLRGEGGRSLGLSRVVPVGGDFPVYVPAHPVQNVREVKMYFAGTRFNIDEIEVMGPPPADLDLTSRTPPVDAEPELPTAESTEKGNGARTAFLKVIAETRLEKLRAIRASIDASANDHEKANGWLRLNQGSKELIALLGWERGLAAVMREARPLGISMGTCGNEPPWDVGVEGYEKYLKLWPSGPNADEAWWWARVNGDRCGEFEGTEEEYAETVERNKKFLAQFPKSRFAVKAEKTMDEAMKELLKLQKHKARP